MSNIDTDRIKIVRLNTDRYLYNGLVYRVGTVGYIDTFEAQGKSILKVHLEYPYDYFIWVYEGKLDFNGMDR
jgi:hypothetical protein